MIDNPGVFREIAISKAYPATPEETKQEIRQFKALIAVDAGLQMA